MSEELENHDDELFFDEGSVLDDEKEESLRSKYQDTGIMFTQEAVSKDVEELLRKDLEDLPVNVQRMKHYFFGLADEKNMEEDARKIYRMTGNWLKNLQETSEQKVQKLRDFAMQLNEKITEQNNDGRQKKIRTTLACTLADVFAKQVAVKASPNKTLDELDDEIEALGNRLLPYLWRVL